MIIGTSKLAADRLVVIKNKNKKRFAPILLCPREDSTRLHSINPASQLTANAFKQQKEYAGSFGHSADCYA